MKALPRAMDRIVLLLGICVLIGGVFGCEKVSEKPRRTVTIASQTVDSVLEFEKAVACFSDAASPNIDEGLFHLRRSAEYGYAEAQFQLFIMMRDYKHVTLFPWLYRAAEQGHRRAQALLKGYYEQPFADSNVQF